MATPIYGWTTPALGSANNVPADLTSLATQIENTIDAIADRTAYAMAAGSFSAGQKYATYTHTVTFPAGRFSVPPIVNATIANSASGSNQLQLVVGTVTSGSAEIIFLLAPGGSWAAGLWCTANWEAVQMTSTTAAG